ncbi:hypothetical protein GOODEAATRI_005003 [Goodea atripinnis]|uniref:Uncharacterized protein n=1 Tax=Goodea atripinnis TaxID=208336 RepID=A0ABV0PBE7_9TELE
MSNTPCCRLGSVLGKMRAASLLTGMAGYVNSASTISLLKTTGRALQEGAGYLLFSSLFPGWYLLLSWPVVSPASYECVRRH